MKLLMMTGMCLSLAACGGGGSRAGIPSELANGLEDDSSAFNPNAAVVNACSAPYYRELEGIYDGQITYEEPQGHACAWEVELVLNADYFGFDPDYKQTCFVEVSYQSILVSGIVDGDDSDCRDIEVSNRALEPYSGAQMASFWVDPNWPVDIQVSLSSDTRADQIYPIGQGPSSFGASNMVFVHDGNGSVTLSPDAFNSGYWSGVMIKN